MNMLKMVMGVVLLLCAIFMVGNAIFCIYEMMNYPSYYSFDDYGAADAARSSYHWTISVVTWITYFLMGVVMLAAAIILPSWWRKGLAAWGIFTCLVMFVAAFILSNRASFNEIGFLWIAAGMWLAILFAALGVAAFLGGRKAAPVAAATTPSPATPGPGVSSAT